MNTTYAILGATGATGSAALRYLLDCPPNNTKLNILVRSEDKLNKIFPDLKANAPFPIAIVIGSSTDDKAVGCCIAGADVIFQCVGSNDIKPGQTITQETIAAILQALHQAKKTKKITEAAKQEMVPRSSPVILFFRATTLNDQLRYDIPFPVRLIIEWALEAGYTDLTRALDLLCSAEADSPNLVSHIVVDPPGLQDEGGTVRTGYELLVTDGSSGEVSDERRPRQSASLNYADLGAAFCELAEKRKLLVGRAVGVSATGRIRYTMLTQIGHIIKAIIARLVNLS